MRFLSGVPNDNLSFEQEKTDGGVYGATHRLWNAILVNSFLLYDAHE